MELHIKNAKGRKEWEEGGKKEEGKKKEGVETKEGINDAILLMVMVMFSLITRSQVFQLRM